MPLPEHLDRARNKLGELRRKNDAEFDFDKADADRAAKELTFAKFAERCPNTAEDEARIRLRLEPYFGAMTLQEIDDDAVAEYLEKRSGEKIIKHHKESKKIVSQSTINKEVSTFRKFLSSRAKKATSTK